MAYNFSPTRDTMKIAEQEYGGGTEIRFTTFTSCIGLIARNDASVVGVHLVIVAPDGSNFDTAAADTAIGLLHAYQQVVIIGQTGIWADNLPGPFNHLVGRLNNPIIIDRNDGVYGGRVHNGNFQTYQNGAYRDV